MTLQHQLQADLKTAMRSGDHIRKSVIRYLRAQIHNEEIAAKTTLDDQSMSILLGKQAQQRRDSIEAFSKGGRDDLADKEKAELAIILEYLPEQIPEEQIIDLVRKVIVEVGAQGPKDMGKVMGPIMQKVRGKADGKKVSSIVSSLLNK